MKISLRIALAVALCSLCSASIGAENELEFTDDFPDDECRFRPYGGSLYFPLRPGLQLFYDNNECFASGECDEQERLQITVTPHTKKVVLRDDGRTRVIFTRIVEEKEWKNEQLIEVSRNYYAACGAGRMRDVYYFGEDVDVFTYLPNGEVEVTHPGQWLAGRRGAEPGIIMPGGAFLLGARYYQEIAPGVALDRAEHVAIELDVQTAAGRFDDCVEVTETTPLEPDDESTKVYCPGVGLVADNELILNMVIDPGR
jgi:hypothetical protein